MPGVDSLLHFIASFSAAEEDTLQSSQSRDVISARFKQIAEVLPAHGEAFERGLISCARLVEVMAPQYLKIAYKVNQRGPIQEHTAYFQSMGRADKLFCYWSKVLTFFLAGEFGRGQAEGRYRQVLSPRKRQEFVKALVSAKFPEVRGIVFSGAACIAVWVF